MYTVVWFWDMLDCGKQNVTGNCSSNNPILSISMHGKLKWRPYLEQYSQTLSSTTSQPGNFNRKFAQINQQCRFHFIIPILAVLTEPIHISQLAAMILPVIFHQY